MKYKYIIALFVAGIALMFVAGCLKIMHTPNAVTWLKGSMAVILLSSVLLIIKLISSKAAALNK